MFLLRYRCCRRVGLLGLVLSLLLLMRRRRLRRSLLLLRFAVTPAAFVMERKLKEQSLKSFCLGVELSVTAVGFSLC